MIETDVLGINCYKSVMNYFISFFDYSALQNTMSIPTIRRDEEGHICLMKN
ncbi:hypothetical protein T190130A13A_150011 [Tenacibaculum sp. 190130A14a]|uniref:Uncharacterized protein n=1 Tax=Tenacibaculum polynesiense TaxID=3137857 RepID=A0ABM9P765_9FLAO